MSVTISGDSGISLANNLAGGSIGTIPYQSATGTTAELAVGTSGQVLTSQGAAAPIWATPSGGVTSLNGQTGAIVNTSLYAIGSYVTGRPGNLTNYLVNDTVAGSSLYATVGQGQYTGSWAVANGAVLVNTGTWRCVGPAWGSSGSGYANSGLWVRIS